jgi:hypothetical protein
LWRNGFRACWLLTLLVIFRAETGRRRDAKTGRPERSDPLTVGRPPASWTLHRRSSAAYSGGQGGRGAPLSRAGREFGVLGDGQRDWTSCCDIESVGQGNSR